jgi:hypothetical protein
VSDAPKALKSGPLEIASSRVVFSRRVFQFSVADAFKNCGKNSHDHQSEITINPTTHKPRATVKKTIRNGILKI